MEFNLYRISRIGFWSKKYIIYSNTNDFLYRVQSLGFFKSGLKIENYHNELKYVIKSKMSFSGYKFELLDAHNRIQSVANSKFSFKKQILEVETPLGLIVINGKFNRKEYTFQLNRQEIAKVSINNRDSQNHIGIAIRSDIDQDLILGLVVLIILKIQIQNAAAAAG